MAAFCRPFCAISPPDALADFETGVRGQRRGPLDAGGLLAAVTAS
jgi:hypothetical protein